VIKCDFEGDYIRGALIVLLGRAVQEQLPIS
jgi:hypothetical protein